MNLRRDSAAPCDAACLDSKVTDITELRPLMFSVAYGMLGSVSEAEDIAQEAQLRMLRGGRPAGEEIRSPSAYAVTIATRLAIDELRSARARREVYVGTWLPEPIVTSDPSTHAEISDQLSMAFLLMLERLSPVERAVLLLREVFDYDYDRIAEIVGRSEANCRQLMARARARVRDERPRFEATAEHRDALLERFFSACRAGDLAGLEALLAEDIAFTGDGGGKVPALVTPVSGRRRVARFVLGLFRQIDRAGVLVEPVQVNGGAGGRAYTPDGVTLGVFALDIIGDKIVAVFNVINPDKLTRVTRDQPA
jgi:RNA polymerase sigma-70 factor (TIGR02957 family)